MSDLRTGSTSPSTPQPVYSAVIQASQKVRILVVEDDNFVRGGIVRLINGQADLACCGEADSIAATPQVVATLKPNLILLDLKLEDGEALDLIYSLRRECPSLPILVLSQHDEKLYAERALQAGASGYVMKEAATEHLLGALRTVLDGNIYLSPAMTTRLIQNARSPYFDQPSRPRV